MKWSVGVVVVVVFASGRMDSKQQYQAVDECEENCILSDILLISPSHPHIARPCPFIYPLPVHKQVSMCSGNSVHYCYYFLNYYYLILLLLLLLLIISSATMMIRFHIITTFQERIVLMIPTHSYSLNGWFHWTRLEGEENRG